ncbi:hypothetical protein CGCVW01_v004862 [Colletotrichum viniferum]|nr:hypothetical protein CGCVW01_v004862 [Colletotrichum viniferum]
MQLLAAILVFASLAVAAPAADMPPAPIQARAAPSPCGPNDKMTWNTGQIPGDGGWIVRILCSHRSLTNLGTNTNECGSSATKPQLDPARSTPGRRTFLITA